MKYKRVLLKLSGEVCRAADGNCLDAAALNNIAQQIKHVVDEGVQLGLVIGGGNIFRGMTGESCGIDRVIGDNMGMLATMINSLALQAALENIGVGTSLMGALDIPKICEPVSAWQAKKEFEQGRVVLFGAGTGNPFFTTDSAAALRAAEIGADVLLKGTKVDGIYTADPMIHPDATRYEVLSYTEALEKRLNIMDSAAFSLCQDNEIPIIVFKFFNQNELLRVLNGESVGTLVKK